MKLANPYYTGPVIKAQRSLDNSTLDFWADADGTLMSATGNSYVTWVGSGTANLLTWYDQSQNDMEALKYPPITLGGGTSNPTTATLTAAPYGNGSYIYSASTQYSTGEFVGALFNNSGNYQSYTSGGGVDAYNGSTGVFTGSTSTTVSGSAYLGAWVQLQLPYAIYPTGYYRLMNSSRNEISHVLAGSNNGTTWTLLNSTTEPAYTTSSFINLNVSASYSYFRLIARAINPANTYGFWSMAQLDLYGRQSLTAGRNALATTASGGNPPRIVIDPLSSIAPYLVGTATANHSAPFVGAAGGPTLYVFPPAAMTSNGPQNITGYPAGGSGNYTASASSEAYGGSAFYAFDSDVSGNWPTWHSSDVGTYSNSDATASATTPGFANGSWLQIQFPSAVTLYSYSIVTRVGWDNRTPYNFYVVGSNDGTTWTLVDTRSAITGWSPPTAKTFTIASPILTAFTYFRLVTTRLNGTNEPSLQIANWSLNGSLTAPAAYQAPSSNVALVLPGTSGNYVNLGTTHPMNFSLATSNLYVESWIYPNSVTSTQVIIGRMPLTTASLGDDWGLYIDTDSKLKLFMNNTVPSVTIANTIGTVTVSQWTHVAASYNTGTNQMYLFINGTVTGPTPFVGTPNYRTLNALLGAGNGLQYPFNGYIRDARVVQGGSVPTTSFTPDQVPFAKVSPTYVPSMGTVVLALYGQFFANGKYVVYFPNGVATSSAYYGLTFSPQTISGSMIQYRTISNPSTYQTFLAGSTDMSIKYTNNTLLGATTDFLG